MSQTIEELAQRVDELERQVRELRYNTMQSPTINSAQARVRLYLKRARENRDARLQAAERIAKLTGVTDSSISIEELHKRMIAGGVRPEDNIGSRGIIEMREE
jgi:hypothetical protein